MIFIFYYKLYFSIPRAGRLNYLRRNFLVELFVFNFVNLIFNLIFACSDDINFNNLVGSTLYFISPALWLIRLCSLFLEFVF